MEEVFLTLLQRIQRHYHQSPSSKDYGHQSSTVVVTVERPPDEAAWALGKQLASTLEEMGQPHVSKGLQEKALTCLASSRINPSVVRGFFETLLSKQGTVQMDDWLPNWIVHTEQVAIVNADQQEENYHPNYDALTAMIRAYAQYKVGQVQLIQQGRRNQQTKEGQKTARLVGAGTSGGSGKGIASTFRKLQTSEARIAYSREFIKETFAAISSRSGGIKKGTSSSIEKTSRIHPAPSKSSPVIDPTKKDLTSSQIRSLLSPLIAVSVLSIQNQFHESLLFLEDIWRMMNALLSRQLHLSQRRFLTSTNEASATAIGDDESENLFFLIDLILWMTNILDLFLLGIPSRTESPTITRNTNSGSSAGANHNPVTCKELAHRWMVTLVELGCTVITNQQHQPSSQASLTTIPKLQSWMTHIISQTLPRLYAVVPSYRIPMDTILVPIRQCCNEVLSTATNLLIALDSAATLRLATIIMACPISEDKQELLAILVTSIHPKLTSKVTTTILRGLASIYLRDEVCGPTCTELLLQIQRNNVKTKPGGITQSPPATEETAHKRIIPSSGGDGIIAGSGLIHNKSGGGVSIHMTNIIQFLEDDSMVDLDNLTIFLSKPGNLFADTNFTAIKQIGCLLFGIGLLLLKEDESKSSSSSKKDNKLNIDADSSVVGVVDDVGNSQVYAYLKTILSQYPHLGISLLPVMIDSINAASLIGDGSKTLSELEFLCEAVVQDTQCAREVWNLLGVELMKPTIPVEIRSSLIRLFPKICSTNKRLYKRVIETLGNTLASNNNQPEDEIRLAVIATIADLAKEDRIRDVTDVIGWVQTFVEDGAGWNRPGTTLNNVDCAQRSVLVYYALLSLHYLVVAQELDYNLVLVVLSKRLCNIHDMDETTKLPLLVIEALALLLGDGESEEDDDSDEDQPQYAGVPPHVSKSVETLLNLALAPKLNPALVGVDKEGDNLNHRKGTLLRCRRNVYDSLSRYSIEGLGIDSDGIKAVCAAAANTSSDDSPSVPQAGIRYSSIKTIIEDGIGLVMRSPIETINDSGSVGIEVGIHGCSDDIDIDTADVSDTLAGLISKLILFEEESLGSRLWQKRGGASNKQNPKKMLASQFNAPMDDTMAKALPSINGVQQFYNKNRCTATALAAMLCFEGKPLSLYADLAGDVANESADPLMRAFTVQANLNASRSVLKQVASAYSSSDGLDKILLEIRDWRYRLDNADNMFLTLASLALYIPDILGPYGDHSSFVQEICEDVWDAYNDHEFERNDIAKLCLGFVGVCAIRDRNVDRAKNIVSILEKSVTSYGGQASFGAYYALAVIAQSCPGLQSKGDESSVEDLSLISQIIGFLVGELVTCFKGNRDVVIGLVTCIKNEEITADVIDSLTTSLKKKSLDLNESKKQNAKSLFIALALCLPALTSVNDELLLGVYCMLENLPWGSGKGIALPSVLHACRNTGLFESKEVERIYAKYAAVFEDGMDKGVSGLDDIFYAVTATVNKTIPITIRRFLVGNRKLFDVEGRANSLLAATISLCSVPCLGCGAQRFTDSPLLSPNASVEDVHGVATLMSEAAASTEWDFYSQAAALLTGFIASIQNENALGNDMSTGGMRLRDDIDLKGAKGLKLPSAQEGTVLDVLMRTLTLQLDQPNIDTTDKAHNSLVKLVGCLGVLSLPGHFAGFLEQMFRGSDAMKLECVKILVSQIRGRPRAVFDGKDYINLALQMSTMPVGNLRSLLGHGNATTVFLESFAEILPRLPSSSVEVAVENVWRLCINQVAQFPAWTVSFLVSIKSVLSSAYEQKGFTLSPKTLGVIRMFLLKRGFAGIRDAPWATTTSSPTVDGRSIVEAYVDCLMEMPITSLIEAEFFTLKDLDGFIGEALRVRCIMILVRQKYFATPSRASGEIASALAWFSRQLVSSEDEIFSATLLQVSCSIAEATAKENSDRKRELILTLLDNLLLIGESSTIVGLQMLGTLVFQWCKGVGSDGDLSLACLCVTRMEKWHELTPPTLQQLFRLIVHDLPFNLATYSRQEKISHIVFNRLWRVYNRWFEQGADQETIDCIRKALICCQSPATEAEEFASLTTSMLL